MLFNSLPFAAFAAIIAAITAALAALAPRKDIRNVILLAASYWFYAQFSPTFLIILAYVTLLNYVAPLAMQRRPASARAITLATVFLTLIPLLTYKYTTFILADLLNIDLGDWADSLLLPVGISFYTFQALSYTIDVFRSKIPARRNPIDVALFIAFFPTVLSGPIAKARHLLPQLELPTTFNPANLRTGVTLFIWGLFKKAVIADRLAAYVNLAYIAPEHQNGATLALAAIFYSIQIYCDFSGYSDMAIGTAKALGFNLQRNFRYPYFATSIKQFWRGWHISLTTWFTEYVYFSLGGNRVPKWRWTVNISLVFLLSGLWHGAATSFLIWGALHAVLYLIEHYAGLQDKNFRLPRLATLPAGLIVFLLVTIAWVYFRADNAAIATTIVTRAFTAWTSLPDAGVSAFTLAINTALLTLYLLLEWKMYRDETTTPTAPAVPNSQPTIPAAATPCEDPLIPLRSPLWLAILLLLTALFSVPTDTFVYFQF